MGIADGLPMRTFHIYMATAALADQLSKLAVFLAPDREILRVDLFGLSPFLLIEQATNTGALFGIGQGLNVLFTLLSGMFLVVMLPLLTDGGSALRLRAGVAFALALACGGVVGNYIDRLLFGHVRDFITVYYWPGMPPWPTFNLADSFICVGVAYTVIYLLFVDSRRPEAPVGRS